MKKATNMAIGTPTAMLTCVELEVGISPNCRLDGNPEITLVITLDAEDNGEGDFRNSKLVDGEGIVAWAVIP